MEAKELLLLLDKVFGESSDSEAEEDDCKNVQNRQNHSFPYRNPTWEQIPPTNGLWLCRDFLSNDQQHFLLAAIENEGWFNEVSHNQAMKFGDLPLWAAKLSKSICELMHVSDFISDGTYSLPSELLWRDPLFDQLIINTYQPGEGICAHVDLLRFGDGIAIISLESSCVMHFSKAEDGIKNISESEKIPVYLNPGSLVLMWGEARYFWKHEINRNSGFQIWEGREIVQKKRTSITLRYLCPIE